jgi:hypothetical protein
MKLCSLSVIVCVVYGAILADVLEYMVQIGAYGPY